MSELPQLGVGVIWFPALDTLVRHNADLIDFLEVEPATVSVAPNVDAVTSPNGPLAYLRSDGRPVVVHGVSCPVANSVSTDNDERMMLAAAAELLNAPWVSEHLSIDRVRGPHGDIVRTGFFLPPGQTLASVEIAAARLRTLREVTRRPVAFETGVNYFRPLQGELTDGAFFAAVAEAADCYILCDLHNLWCNEKNGRQPVADVLGELPAERICEVHLAGGQERGGFLLDAHSDIVDPELEMLAGRLVEQLPALRALTFELIPDYIGPNGIEDRAYRAQLERLHAIWDGRGRRFRSTSRSRSRPHPHNELLEPTAWESTLWSALYGGQSMLDADPGLELYRHLIATVRAGGLVTNLPLAYRLLATTLGAPATDDIIDHYRRSTSPAAWASQEARAFAAYLREQVTDVPHLQEVVDFELAASEVAATGVPRTVRFSCDPMPLLNALRRGRRAPVDLPFREVEVVVSP